METQAKESRQLAQGDKLRDRIGVENGKGKGTACFLENRDVREPFIAHGKKYNGGGGIGKQNGHYAGFMCPGSHSDKTKRRIHVLRYNERMNK